MKRTFILTSGRVSALWATMSGVWRAPRARGGWRGPAALAAAVFCGGRQSRKPGRWEEEGPRRASGVQAWGRCEGEWGQRTKQGEAGRETRLLSSGERTLGAVRLLVCKAT